MRRFRFVGDTEEGWLLPVKRGEIYFDNYFFGRGGSLISQPLNQSDWQEVFDESKQLHKDTDLGVFTLGIINGTISNQLMVNSMSDQSRQFLVENAILLAKELIKQLDKEVI